MDEDLTSSGSHCGLTVVASVLNGVNADAMLRGKSCGGIGAANGRSKSRAMSTACWGVHKTLTDACGACCRSLQVVEHVKVKGEPKLTRERISATLDCSKRRHSKLGSITIETLSSSLIEAPRIQLMPLPSLLSYDMNQVAAPKP